MLNQKMQNEALGAEFGDETPPRGPYAPSAPLDIPEDYYELLGVDPGASQEEINAAYREKIREHHPDVNRDDPEGSHEWTVALNTARGWLSSGEKRRIYYESGHDAKRSAAELKRKDAERREENRGTIEAERNKAMDQARDDVRRAAGASSPPGGGRSVGGEGGGEPPRYFYRGDKQYRYDPTHPNPFHEEQDDLRTWDDRFIEKIVSGAKKARERISVVASRIASATGLRENPITVRKTLATFDEMERRGEAEYMGETPGLSYADYQTMQKTYKRTGNFKNYNFRSVGVYDDNGDFTGTVRTYRIKKRGK